VLVHIVMSHTEIMLVLQIIIFYYRYLIRLLQLLRKLVQLQYHI